MGLAKPLDDTLAESDMQASTTSTGGRGRRNCG